MAVIRLYQRSNLTDPIIIERPCFADWLREMGGLPDGYRVYSGAVAASTDITEQLYENPELMLECDDTVYDICAPMGGAGLLIPIIASVIVAAAIVLLMPKISIDTANRKQSSATNSFGSRENEPRVNERIDDIFGTINGHLPSLWQYPYYRYNNNTQFEYFYACVGRGKYQFNSTPTDGVTPVTRIPGAKVNVFGPGKSPNNSAATPDLQWGGLINTPLLTITESKETASTELSPPNDLGIQDVEWKLTGVNSTTGLFEITPIDGFTLTDYFSVGDQLETYQMVYLASNGSVTLYHLLSAPDVWGGVSFSTFTDVDLSSGGHYIITAVSENSITVTLPTGSAAVTAAWASMSAYAPIKKYYTFTTTSGVKLTKQSAILDASYFEDNPGTIPVAGVATITKSPQAGAPYSGIVGPYAIPENTESLIINLVSRNGFYKLKGTTETTINAEVEFYLRETDADGVETGNSVTLGPYPYVTNSDSRRKQAASTIDIDLTPHGYQYATISGKRLTYRDKADDVSNVDVITWDNLYFANSVNKSDFGDVTCAQVVFKANPTSLGIKSRQFKVDITRLITPYLDGGAPESVASDYWDDVVVHMACDPFIGRMTINDIDAQGLRDVRNQQVAYFGHSDTVRVGYDFDDTKTRFQDAYDVITNAANCQGYTQGAVYRAYPQLPRSESSKQFTHRNRITGTAKRTRSFQNVKYNDGVEVTFRNNAKKEFETVSLHVNGATSVNPLRIELSGCISKRAALIRAHRELNIIKYQRQTVEFEADGISYMTVPGERVDVVDATRIVKRDNNENQYRVYDGEVLEVNGMVVTLSQKVYFDAGETYSIRFTRRDGSITGAITCTAGESANKVVLASLPDEPIYTGYMQARTMFTLAPDAERTALPFLIRDIEAKETGGLEVRKLSGVNYDARYYQQDLLL